MVRKTKNAAAVQRVPDAGPASPAKGREPSQRQRPRTNLAAGDDIGAAELAGRVAGQLGKLRRDRHLSLDELSSRSGVSRAALSQIEGQRTNPTLAVLWKVAVGLGVPFQDLLGSKEADSVLVLRSGDSTVLRSGDGRTESRLLSPGGADTTVEVYELKLAPKAVHKSEPHARETAETLVVLTGSLRLEVGDATYELNPGDSVFFKADVPHSYVNPGTRETRVVDVIHYQRV
ncbi:MAG TPA: XRE family transcriptional regulator [Polyangiaceae bacterium]|nr:XRE family transcriptional regulator [Polyangiaceae bacterium]